MEKNFQFIQVNKLNQVYLIFCFKVCCRVFLFFSNAMAMLSLKSVFGSYWIQKQSFVLDTPSQCSWPPDTAPEAAPKIDV